MDGAPSERITPKQDWLDERSNELVPVDISILLRIAEKLHGKGTSGLEVGKLEGDSSWEGASKNDSGGI